MSWQTTKTLGISIALFVPALSGMRAIEKHDESLPVEARHRGYTPLHVAAYLGQVTKIAELLAAYENNTAEVDALVCAKSINGCTPLHVAAEQGQLSAVEVLIAKNQSLVNMQDTADLTPLAYAATHGHTDVIKCLIAHGANIYLTSERATPLYSGVLQGSLKVSIYLQDAVTSTQGYLPFHRAAQNGHLEAMKILQPDERICGMRGYMLAWHLALPCAVESGKPEILAFVMNMLAGRRDQEMEGQIRVWGRRVTPLLLAASYGHVSLVQLHLFQEHARLDDTDINGACALHYAARYGHANAVQLLLVRNDQLVKIKTRTQVSALHEAAECGHCNVIELLLDHKAEIDAQDGSGATPLALAAKSGHVEALVLLISRGASLTVTDSSGRTPLHKAAAEGRKECVEVLLQNNADIEAKDLTQQTPLLCAADNGQLEVIKCLYNHNADIKQHSTYGNALILALKHHDEILRYLIEHTNVELTSCSNRFSDRVPVLFDAVCLGISVEGYKAVSFLIKKGAALDAQLTNGRTALHYAVQNCAYGLYAHGVIRLLVRAGASMLCADNAGITPLAAFGDTQVKESHAYQVLPACYFQNRSSYLSGRLPQEDTLDAVFNTAAYFLDIPVLEAFKDHLKERLSHWHDSKERTCDCNRNLLMDAITKNDLDGIDWLLDQNICNISDKDIRGHDALWFALSNGAFNNSVKLGIINKLLAAGATVTEDHLIYAANHNYEKVSEPLMRLLVVYRYSQRPINERISMFK